MRFAQVSAPQLALLFGLDWPDLHSFTRPSLIGEDTSRSRGLRPTARAQRLVDWALHHSAAEHAAQKQPGSACCPAARGHYTAPQQSMLPSSKRALHRSAAEHAAQQHPAPQLQLHLDQPLRFIVFLRPVSHASSGTSSPAAVGTAQSLLIPQGMTSTLADNSLWQV